MPNPFFYLAHKFLNRKSPKPINSPQYSVVGNELLNLFVDVRKRVTALEQPKEVQTHFAEDCELLKNIHTVSLPDLYEKIGDLHEETEANSHDIGNLKETTLQDIRLRLEHLENNHIQTLTRRISANWQRPRRKDGRWTKKGGGHANI